MDFWTYFNGFWIFPLLCFLFMALMMLGMMFGWRGMGCGCGHRHVKSQEDPTAPRASEPHR